MLADLWKGFIDTESWQQGQSGRPEQNSVRRVNGDTVLFTERKENKFKIRISNINHTSTKFESSSLFCPHLALSTYALSCSERADAEENL